MKYLNAQTILPDPLVKELQNYIQGGYIYVPVQQERRYRWNPRRGYKGCSTVHNRRRPLDKA